VTTTYKNFEMLRAAMGQLLRVNDAILDGEIVCLDGSGHSMFKDLPYRRGEPVFYVFDLLWLKSNENANCDGRFGHRIARPFFTPITLRGAV
jgi:ATP-dependent DNA ligase